MLLGYSRDDFERFLQKFTDLYHYIFIFPKPTVAVINGHAIAGGCMLATACDVRLMVSGRAKISLNEITFGATVTAGAVEMLKYCVGQRHAQTILFSGAMYSAEEAHEMGLIDQVTESDKLTEVSKSVAQGYLKSDLVAFTSIKRLMKGRVAERMQQRELESMNEFMDIWYSESTWENLQSILIRD